MMVLRCVAWWLIVGATGYAAALVDVAVIGGGCAGLSAAFTVGYLRHSALLFTGDMPGGQLMGSLRVENIPGVMAQPGYAVIEQLEEQARAAGVQFVSASVVGLSQDGEGAWVVAASTGERWSARAVILAMGGIPRTLRVPGEAALINSKIFTCALCDGQQAEGKSVYIVGGGDASIDAICTLQDFGMRTGRLLVRGSSMRAAPALQERLNRCNVTVEYGTTIVAVADSGDGVLVSIKSPQGIEERYADRIFYAIGHAPNTGYSWLLPYVTCDIHGYIVVDAHQATRTAGLFAAGDIASPYFHQASYAIGCAQLAAKSAVDYCCAHAR